MLGLLLGLFTYDTVTTFNRDVKERKEQEVRQKRLRELQYQLKNPVTKGHRTKCICQLCINRRSRLADEHNTLLAKG